MSKSLDTANVEARALVIQHTLETINQMRDCVDSFYRQFRRIVIATVFAVLLALGAYSQTAHAVSFKAPSPTIAYNIDFGMDLARAERTIEHYGEEIRDIVEQALRNNENHPESKDSAKNSYRRESSLNSILPESRSSAFSQSDLAKLKQTEHPRDRLR